MGLHYLLGAAATVGLLSCASEATVTPVGGARYAIDDCDSQGDCYEAAAEQCRYGYDPIDEDSSSSRTVARRYGDAVVFRSHRTHEMIIQCRPPIECGDEDPCAYGFRCVPSQMHEGHSYCVMNR
jgi:hypothetical protein